ncbi:glycosyltransferase [Profundibacterium mesophilum]|uniref:Dolichol-phosphate mannosyltransferase n=1 Tax=Profundibacterium mesophilum KAUST100406-0324 TaxID=1037889 RepID=A0A921NSH3_9RHOB|nr:glycosyltransferase [Profundibacterium mesophilum]KAF0674590.1 dolichol-phosphate mannosyltransferase [Profundibacterium mesophilum KAUST100406-0324]
MRSEITDAGAGRLVAVVVTHQRLHQLERTIARLLESPAHELSAIVVIDNASSDGTPAWLSAQDDPRLHVHRSEVNLGGAGGFEMGVRIACADHEPDWLLLTDDDGRPGPGALARFHALPAGKWDAVAAAVYLPGGAICDMNRPALNPFDHLPVMARSMAGGGREGFHLGPEDYAGPARRVDIASFVGFFVSAGAVSRAGLPEGRLFLYADDSLYTLRMTRAGARIGFEPSIVFEHDCSTFSGRPGQFTPVWKSYYYHRNLLLLYRLAAGWLFWPAMLAVLPKWLLRTRVQSRGKRAPYLRLLGLALRDGLMGHTGRGHAVVLRAAGED